MSTHVAKAPPVSLRVFCLFLVATAALAYAPRVAEWNEWSNEPDRFMADGVSAVGADSYYWLRIARELSSGVWDSSPVDPSRNWPHGVARDDAPWLSRAIALLADATGSDVYRAAAWFGVATSCLFVFPLAFFGWRIGWPAAGLMGGLVGAAARAYANRTSVVEIETEAVNLFGLCSLALAFSLPDPRQSRGLQWLGAALCGAGLWLFVAWYDRPQFWLVMLATFAVCLLARGFPISRTTLLVAIFALCANPATGVDSAAEIGTYLRDYLAPTVAREALDSPEPSPLEYASITNLISELQTHPLGRSLSRVLEPEWLAAFGLGAFVLWALWHWRVALPLVPLAGLGLMGLLVAARFVMFLGPLVGFGLGVALSVLARALPMLRAGAPRPEAVACLLAVAGFGGFQLMVMEPFPLRPHTPVSLVDALRSVAPRVPAGALVAAPWNSGYMLQDVLSAATLNDGLRPDPVVEHLRARAVTSTDPRDLLRTLAFLARHDRASVDRRFRVDYAAALTDLLAGEAKIPGPAFVLLTPYSNTPLAAELRRGQWDFAAGSARPMQFTRLGCRRELPLWRCRSRGGDAFALHIETGQMTPGPLLEKLVILRGGSVQREVDYEGGTGGVLQIVLSQSQSGSASSGVLMERRVFESIWNQLYMLGRPDERYFEPVLNRFPIARLYRVRSCDEHTPATCE